jgi:hypothetical protein
MMMIDVTSPKVLAPAAIFAALQLAPSRLGLLPRALLVSLALFIVYNFALKRTFTRADLVVPALLFILLTPGLLVTLPPGGTVMEATAVHTIVFGIVFAFMRTVFAKYY